MYIMFLFVIRTNKFKSSCRQLMDSTETIKKCYVLVSYVGSQFDVEGS